MDRWRRERMEQEEALRMCKMNEGGANSKEKQDKERKMGNEGTKEGPKTKGKQEEGKKMSMEGSKGIEDVQECRNNGIGPYAYIMYTALKGNT